MATTSHIDYRKINYDQILNQPIINTTANVDTLTSAGVYDKGDGKRYIVAVSWQTITQTVESKDGYQERTSTNGGTTWGEREVVVFPNWSDKWDKVIISLNEPQNPEITTAWLNITDDSFNIRDGTDWHTISGTEADIPVLPTFTGSINGTTATLINANIEDGDGIVIIGVTSGTAAGSWSWEVTTDWEWTLTSTATEDNVSFKYIIIKEDGLPFSTDAENITYDNTDSGLTAANVQDAIDEVNTKAEMGSQIAVLPTASSTVAGKIYQYIGTTTVDYINWYFYKCVESSTPGTYEWINIDVQNWVAANVSYDNTNSGLVATNVQAAIDEVNSKVSYPQRSTMPTASASEVDNIYQFVWTTTVDYTNGYFYKCVNNGGAYSWQPVKVFNDAKTLEELTTVEVTNVQNGDTLKYNTTTSKWENKPDIDTTIQRDTLPTATASELNKIYQYTGTTTATLTNGFFYKCVAWQTAGTYEWQNIDVQIAKTTLVDLEDTNITNPQDWDVIKYDATTQKYVNAPDEWGLAYTPTSPYKPKYHRVGTQAQYDALSQYYTEEENDTIFFTV